ncbi:hypothetical protein RJT34_25243 [Clitoria ternatea]|uniref:RBR-type E3 ubiquitin transferase n=1 Tax=Clitoria ternatea TaxID=43366 RepID=A0AAN9ILE3_CLITE
MSQPEALNDLVPLPNDTHPLHVGVDEFYFSAMLNDDDQTQNDLVDTPISDENYAQQLQFQETLMSSLISSQPTKPTPILCFASSSTPSSSNTLQLPGTSKLQLVTEIIGEPSSLIMCEICAEPKQSHEMFRNRRCERDHSFCSECIAKQVATKIQEGVSVVSCPGFNCNGVLELDACMGMLPKEVVDRWHDALCEAHFLTVSKFYCPFRDCSAMMLVDEEGGDDIRESECPICHRLFCARCNVPWHPGILCEEFQKLDEDERGREDLLVRELVNQKKWSRCPQCKFYVEKVQGCLHITCRCRFEFCYACGEQWTVTHGGCQRN